MKLKKATTVLLTAVFLLTACASAGAAGSYADKVPITMDGAISEMYVKTETPMDITCTNDDGNWSVMARGGYVKHDTGEHVDYIVTYTGMHPKWASDLAITASISNKPANWEVLAINGQPWQTLDNSELIPLEEFLNFLGKEDIEYFRQHPEDIVGGVPTYSSNIKESLFQDNTYSNIRQVLPAGNKKMISIYADRTAVALYEANKVGAEHLKAWPYMKDGQLMVPLRGVVDYLGAEIGWDNATKTVTLNRGEKKTKLSAKDVEIKDGNTMVPVSFLSEQLGFTVKWMGSIKSDVLRADIYN